MRAKLLRIDVHAGAAGLWHATSPDMPMLRVTETSHEEVLEQIPIVLEAFCTISGQAVAAYRLERNAGPDHYRVIVPTPHPRAPPDFQGVRPA